MVPLLRRSHCCSVYAPPSHEQEQQADTMQQKEKEQEQQADTPQPQQQQVSTPQPAPSSGVHQLQVYHSQQQLAVTASM